MNLKRIILAALSLSALSAAGLLFAAAASAENGAVFKQNCPYSCKSQGIDKKHCKDWKEGGMCVVEILSGAKGRGQAEFRSACPLSCKSLNVRGKCKDWKEGEICVVKF